MSSAVDNKKDFFGHTGQAQMYKEFRPQYTHEIVEYVISKVPDNHRDVYVDIACGSGQLTKLLSPYFAESIGIDRSLEQLSQANDSRTKFMKGSAFALPFDDKSVDLITIAQALHWLRPYEDLFKEVKRVLKPGGVFVTVAYSFPQLVNKSANDIVTEFYVDLLGSHKSPGQPGCWWDTNRPTIDGQYADIDFPSSSIDRATFPAKVSMSISHFVSYLRTFSSYRTYMESHTVDPLIELQGKVDTLLGDTELIEVVNPFFAVSFAV